MNSRTIISRYPSTPEHFQYNFGGILKVLKHKLLNLNKFYAFEHNGKKYYGRHVAFTRSICNCFCEDQKVFTIKNKGVFFLNSNLIFCINDNEKIVFKKKENKFFSFLSTKNYSLSSMGYKENLSFKKINQAKYVFYRNDNPIAVFLIDAPSLSVIAVEVIIEKHPEAEAFARKGASLILIYSFGVYLFRCVYKELMEQSGGD